MEQLDRIEQKVDKQDTKLDKLQEDVSNVRTNVAINTADLLTHIRRTQLLEEIVLPMQTKWAMFEGGLKLVGIVAMLAGIVDVILRLLHR
jgi:hypothetical protein